MDKKNTTYSDTRVFLIVIGILIIVAIIVSFLKSKNNVPVLHDEVSTSTSIEATTTVSIPATSTEATTTNPTFPTTGFDPR